MGSSFNNRFSNWVSSGSHILHFGERRMNYIFRDDSYPAVCSVCEKRMTLAEIAFKAELTTDQCELLDGSYQALPHPKCKWGWLFPDGSMLCKYAGHHHVLEVKK